MFTARYELGVLNKTVYTSSLRVNEFKDVGFHDTQPSYSSVMGFDILLVSRFTPTFRRILGIDIRPVTERFNYLYLCVRINVTVI